MVTLYRCGMGGCKEPSPEKVIDRKLLPFYETEENVDDVVIGFSGGTDGLTCALRLKEIGKNPILFHVKGLTKSNQAAEWKAVQRLTDMLGAEMYSQPIYYDGLCDYVESPVRNCLVLAMMIDFMIESGDLTTVMMGNQSSSRMGVNGTNSDFTGVSDTVEVYDAFVGAIKATFPQFRMFSCVEEESSKYCYLWYKYPEYIKEASWCLDRMNAAGANNWHRRKIIEKYVVSGLPDHCCLCCYKCVAMYLTLKLAGFDFVKVLDEDGVQAHCYSRLRKKLTEWGISHENLSNEEVAEKFDVNRKNIEDFKNDPSTAKNHLRFFEETGAGIVYLDDAAL